jgi:hypothetical protein
VSKSEFTKWEWEVKPQAQGRQKLHLTLSVLIVIDGTSTHRTIRTFERDIEVEVTRRQWIAAFLEKNWQWLWTAALVPIAGWLWSRRKGKGNETRSDQPQGQSLPETRGGNPWGQRIIHREPSLGKPVIQANLHQSLTSPVWEPERQRLLK